MASVQKRVTKNGKATYRVQIRRKGQPPLTATFDRKTDAVKWAEDKETEVRQNRHFRYAEAKKHSVADTIDRYIETVLPRKPKSSYNQKPQLLWWKNKIGTVSLADLSPQVISSCRDLLEKDTVCVMGEDKNSVAVARRIEKGLIFKLGHGKITP